MEYSISFYVSVVWSSAGGVEARELISSFGLSASLMDFYPFGLSLVCGCHRLLMYFYYYASPSEHPYSPLPLLAVWILCLFCGSLLHLYLWLLFFIMATDTHTHFYLLCLSFSPSHSLSRSLSFSFFAGAFIYIRFLFSTLRCRRIYKYKWVLLDEG